MKVETRMTETRDSEEKSMIEDSEELEYETANNKLRYGINDRPNIGLCLLLALQHFLTCFGSNVAISFIIAPSLCLDGTEKFHPPISDSRLMKSKILSTIFFTSGISTLLQVTLGSRLPIMQGGSFSFLPQVIALLSQQSFSCELVTKTMNGTFIDFGGVERTYEELWTRRMMNIQGAIILAGLFEFLIGLSGIVGVIMRFIGPLTISPVICLIGLSVMEPAIEKASQNWVISCFCITIIILCSQILNEIEVQIGKVKIPIFGLFPVLIGLLTSYILCCIITFSVDWDEHLANNNSSSWQNIRIDTRIGVIRESNWIQLILPFQFGLPVFTLGGFLAMLSGSLASMLESIGDYYSLADICALPPPPRHAINRGITTEGIGCMLSGIFGTGNGATSFSENIGAIAITRAASRLVMQVAGILLIVFSLCGKFSSLFVTIPDPVVGGLFFVMFGMITGVGLSNLKNCSLHSGRNLFVFGFSLFIGLALPSWIKSRKSVLNTGSDTMDELLFVILSTAPFIGGFWACLLDNIIKGTDEERGILTWNQIRNHANSAYEVPILKRVTKFCPKLSWLPIFPPKSQ